MADDVYSEHSLDQKNGLGPVLVEYNFRWEFTCPIFTFDCFVCLEQPNKQGRNTSHSYRAFEYALKAANILEDADWALQLREAAGKGGKGSLHLDQLVVDVLLKAGRLEETRAILKVRTQINPWKAGKQFGELLDGGVEMPQVCGDTCKE